MTDLDLDKIKQTLAEYERAKLNGAGDRQDTRAQYNQWFSAHIVDLIDEVERLRAINKYLGGALVGMVGQHTEPLDDSYTLYGHSFMSADEGAFDALVEAGLAEHVSEGYSIRLKKNA